VSKKVSLRDIADRLGVSVKTVSGALSGETVRMSEDTRKKIRETAEEMGYQPNIVARAMRQGVLPIIGLVAEGLITLPFATEIVRSLDNTGRGLGLSIMATNVGTGRSIDEGIAEARRFLPRAIAFATMFHRPVTLTPEAAKGIDLMINCFDTAGRLPAIVPDEVQAARTITALGLAKGRRRVAFLNLPGILAGELRAQGFFEAHDAAGLPPLEGAIRPATRGTTYTEVSPSLVPAQIAALMAGPKPDMILCGNDRVALEVYGVLHRLGLRIPEDIAVASFDNQAEIARRLDPPLTTMALPHRAMGRKAAEILAGTTPPEAQVQRIPFRLIERSSL
jgi:DNA-binding LacI/PurR family transcriptional regulator